MPLFYLNMMAEVREVIANEKFIEFKQALLREYISREKKKGQP